MAAAAASRAASAASATSSMTRAGRASAGRQDLLEGHAVLLGEDGAQALVPGHDVGQGRFQGGRVEVAFEAQRQRDVVGRPTAPPAGAGTTAGAGRRTGAAARAAAGGPAAARGLASRQTVGQLGDGGRLEQGADGQLHARGRRAPG